MRFGLFGSAQATRGATPADSARGFRDYVETNVEAEALGYHASFLVEHHFTGMGQVSASLDLQTWVAAKTTTLRIGTAVIVLPWHNPILLAEQAATLDLMSGGRLDLGVGRGYRHNEFDGFCLAMDEAEARFDEALDVMTKAWTVAGRFSHQGRFWKYKDIVLEPPCAQEPHPPVWIAAGQAASIAKVARLGCNLLLDQFADAATVADRIAFYKSELETHGHRFDPMRVALARNVYVAENKAEAAAALDRQAGVHAKMMALSQTPDGTNRSHITAYAGATESAALYGTPDEIAAELDKLHEAGVHYILINGGMQVRQTLRRFAADVMPAFAARAETTALRTPTRA